LIHLKSDPNNTLAREYVARHGDLASLASQASQLIELRRLFRAIAPAGLAEACTVANLRAGVLVLMADNSAVSAKLKHAVPQLTAGFQQKGWQVSAIKVQVQGAQDR
jgi:hypothetical protein